MMKAEEVKVLDRNAEFFGTPPEKLMEAAGKGVADYINRNHEKQTILIFCGLGNNGGDGFVAARYLSEKHQVSCFLLGTEEQIKTRIAKINFNKLKSLPITIYDQNSSDKLRELINDSSLIIDAMLGIGLSGELRSPYDLIVQQINKQNDKTIIAVDVPTGLGLDQAVHPNTTITFHESKQMMYDDTCGNIIIVDIGIPSKAIDYVGPGDLSVFYPRPKKQSHKGQNGRVLIIGGGPFTGAPALSGLAALRSGADLVSIAAPKYAARSISTYSPNLIVKPLTEDDIISTADNSKLEDLFSIADSIVIGPGMGSSHESAEAVRQIVPKIINADIPLVIDADALKALKNHYDLVKNSTTVITPHAMEFKHFTGVDLPDDIEKRMQLISQWAADLGICIFVKGPIDILSDGTSIKKNDVHHQAMTVGGTGDVLAGIIGCLLSKKVPPMQVMRMAAFLNGDAGCRAFREKSFGLLATDVIDQIPNVLKKYL